MNITEAQHVQTLIRYVLSGTDHCDFQRAQEAAQYLAGRAYNTLHAGPTPPSVAEWMHDAIPARLEAWWEGFNVDGDWDYPATAEGALDWLTDTLAADIALAHLNDKGREALG